MEEQKKYYWLKLKKDFFKRHDIRIVEEMPNGKDYILFYMKLLLESIDHEGELRFSDTIPYNESMLATITNTNIDIVRSAMQVFTELKMIEILDDGTVFMTEVLKMIGSASNSDTANRQRRFREKKRQELCANNTDSVTKCNAGVTLGVTKDNESKSKRESKRIELEGELEEKKEEAPALDDDYVFINRPVSDEDISRLLDILFNVCPNSKKFSRDQIQILWEDSFKGVKANVLHKAVVNHIKVNGYFPTLHEINEQIQRVELFRDITDSQQDPTDDSTAIPDDVMKLFSEK